MKRLHQGRRWVAASVLAACGLSGSNLAWSQDVLVQPSAGNSRLPSIQSVQPIAPAAKTAELPATLPTLPDSTAAKSPAAPGELVPTSPLPPLATEGPAVDGGAPCPPGGSSGDTTGDRFANVPSYPVLPRFGYFFNFPSGTGYYKLSDQIRGIVRDKPTKYPYPRVGPTPFPLFDYDWRYLDDPNNTDTDYMDFLKRIRFANDTMLATFGGELRARYSYEENSRGFTKFYGQDHSYDLYRARFFGDFMFTEYLRLYAEFISATSPNHGLDPLPIDRNYADFLNLFIDAQTIKIDDKPLWFRLGRQELAYGSQRLISPLDWANTQRTFQGGKFFWRSEKNDVDAFVVQPVIPNATKFDSVDNNVLFAGLWYTHRPRAGVFVDAYYLFLDDTNPIFEGQGGVKGGKSFSTIGGRYIGNSDQMLFDMEGMVQFGSNANQGLFAKAFTAGTGYYFKETWAQPTLWAYFDYASGSPVYGEGTLNQTFNQLFPFGHYYLGFLDFVGRKNIIDASAYLTFYPENWLQLMVQCHNFWLDSPRDALYNAAGLPIREDRSGSAGSYVGTELDFTANFHLTNHSDIFLTYSYMFAGRYLLQTAPNQSAKDNPQAVYLFYNYRF